jgi:hypothetical protein
MEVVMSSEAATPPLKTTAHAGAYLAFEQNLDYIAHLLVLRRRETAAAKAAALRIRGKVKKNFGVKNHQKALNKLTVLQLLRPFDDVRTPEAATMVRARCARGKHARS